MRLALPAALLASLTFAAPAFGQVQAQPTVGQPTVITDPASQLNGTTTPAPAPPQPQTSDGNHQADLGDSAPPPLHVDEHLIGHRPALSNATRVSSTAPARTMASAAATRDPRPQPAAAAGTSARQLPFTGIDAWQIALVGIALLASGVGLRRLLAVLLEPVQ